MTTDDVMKSFRGVRIGRSSVAELLGLSLFGLFLAAIAAYDGESVPARERYPYWQLAMLGGGVIAALIEPWVARLFPGRPRVFAVAQLIAMTPPIALWVSVFPVLVFGRSFTLEKLLWTTPSVMTINVAVVGLAWLTRTALRQPLTKLAPPDGVAPPELRRRLPPRLARARLIAVEAEDHYLRIRTEAGSALVLMRLADALAALEGADGFRVHRSWWVARTGVEAARWKAGRGELTLSDGAVAPVSRTYAAALRGTDWAAPAA
ncbi:LytTR family DNA-binding domain-containing protein [Phenylobacterium sp.]|uniref:LytTR family DNA-binding domain-containing protein n=1 Tax=Phenylobacterium sp. TaxID=1871053 RepID=UPI002811FFBC|nr:LytTR family DNA-binding domain-containing protein [Phenylobacterium sp.]